MYKRILLLTLFMTIGFTWNLFNQIELTKKNGAMCMDGSQANIYTYEPDTQKPPNKLLIYFQQIWQGWCPKDQLNTTIAHCYKYISDKNYMDFGSSNNYPQDTFFLSGILSSGSIFANWYKVIIKSCDGGSYFGDSLVSFKNKTLNFRGRKNVIQSLQYLKSIGWIQNRDQVLLVGLLNGGLAALAWADYVKQYTTAKIRVLADAAIWENGVNDKTKKNQFQNRMKIMDKLFMNNGVKFPNSKCQSANSDDLSKCFYASELVKHIDPSINIMFLQSYYDGWAITQILGLQCAEQFASLSECSQQHRNYIQQYHKKISESLHQMIKLSNVGAFGIACIAHYFTNGRFDDDTFSVPMKSQMMALNVTSNWLANKPFKIHLDQVQWPHNTPCSRKVAQNNLVTQ